MRVPEWLFGGRRGAQHVSARPGLVGAGRQGRSGDGAWERQAGQLAASPDLRPTGSLGPGRARGSLFVSQEAPVSPPSSKPTSRQFRLMR